MPADAEKTGPHSGWWHCAALRHDGSLAWYAVVDGGLHPDGARVELPEDVALETVGDRAMVVARLDDEAVVGLEVTRRLAPDAPPLWFALLDEPDGRPPALHLVAFSGHDVAPGTLVDRAALRELPVRSADQLGAVRWYPATGEIDQVYVAPRHRRSGIASALLVGGSAVNRAQGGPRFWSDGQRTALGDRLRNTDRFRRFGADLTHLAPPMTPFEER